MCLSVLGCGMGYKFDGSACLLVGSVGLESKYLLISMNISIIYLLISISSMVA
jgi:hypothetical protein